MSDSNPSRKLTFEQIDTTHDTGDPVIQAQLQDTNSLAIFTINYHWDAVMIHLVDSFREGDMSVLLDEIVRQAPTSGGNSGFVVFTNPLDWSPYESDRVGDRGLFDKLDGFEKTEIEPEELPDDGAEVPTGDAVRAYVGVWHAGPGGQS